MDDDRSEPMLQGRSASIGTSERGISEVGRAVIGAGSGGEAIVEESSGM